MQKVQQKITEMDITQNKLAEIFGMTDSKLSKILPLFLEIILLILEFTFSPVISEMVNIYHWTDYVFTAFTKVSVRLYLVLIVS
jgi:hypothetical protein